MIETANILSVLDDGAKAFVFPMLDNGYVYLAASRLSLFRSDTDWAMVFEIFGYSPRAGIPDLGVTSFGSNLVCRKSASDFVSAEAYDRFLESNRWWQQQFFFPIMGEGWIAVDDAEMVNPEATFLQLRGNLIPLPDADAYRAAGWTSGQVDVAILARALAASHRGDVLAQEEERRINLAPEMRLLLVLDDWLHPDVVDPDCLPSSSEIFQQLARVLETGEIGYYRSSGGNTHWSNWPDGGSL